MVVNAQRAIGIMCRMAEGSVLGATDHSLRSVSWPSPSSSSKHPFPLLHSRAPIAVRAQPYPLEGRFYVVFLVTVFEGSCHLRLPRDVVVCAVGSRASRADPESGVASLSRSYRYDPDARTEDPARPRYTLKEHPFRCLGCRQMVTPLMMGGHHRNHCPICLTSRHVDEQRPGDRRSRCGARMSAIGWRQRVRGEYVVVHHCLGCGIERVNRVAADDVLDVLFELPYLPDPAVDSLAECTEDAG